MIRMEARSFARSGSKAVARLRSTDAKALAFKELLRQLLLKMLE